MNSIFKNTYNKLIIQQAEENKSPVDPKTLDDDRVKKLLKYNVNLAGMNNSKNKNLKTKIDQDNLIINGLRYQSIYDNIVQLELFAKIYPGIDKQTCKLWSVSNDSSESKNFAENQHNPKWIRMIGKTINKVVKFQQTFDQNLDKCVSTEANGYKEDSKNTSKEDLETITMSNALILFYVDESGKILKPANLDDEKYNKMCEILANIAISMLTQKFDTQGLEKLTNENGQSLSSIGKQLIKKKATAKAQEDEALKTKFKAFLKDTFKLYKTVCKETFAKFGVHIQAKAWGKETLQKLIQIGNKQVESGEAEIGFPDINFVFGHSVSMGETAETQTKVNS